MRKKASILVGIALAVAAAASAGSMVSYPSGSETVSGYLAAPGGAGKKPGIVVIQEWWGLNDWVKAKTDEFAKQGTSRSRRTSTAARSRRTATRRTS